MEISGCEFYQNKNLLYIFGSNLIISNCLFHNNNAPLTYITIGVGNVEISGCEFYQNKNLLYIFGSNLIMSNCLFHNNNAPLALITIEVVNVEISGCEFYQNKGGNYLIFTILDSNSIDSSIYNSFDMDNCSIYGNDAIETIFHLEALNSETMFTITNCLFSNNTSGGNILDIMNNILFMSNINLISNKIKWIEFYIRKIFFYFRSCQNCRFCKIENFYLSQNVDFFRM